MTKRLRIGSIGYLNALPFFQGLARRLQDLLKGEGVALEWVTGCPTAINEKFASGKVDCGLVSSLAAADARSHCYVAPGLAIGSRLASRSVLLWSRLPLSELDGKEIAVTAASLSSRALLQILLARRYNFENRYAVVGGEASALARSGAPAFLVIGDEALFFEPPGKWNRYDLAKLWWEWQGVPFCFALWAFHERLVKEQPGLAGAVQRALRLTLSRNLKRLPQMLAESGCVAPGDPRFDVAAQYLKELIYRMDHPLREGLFRFFALAEQEGLLPMYGTLNFLAKEDAFERDRLRVRRKE